LNLSPGTMPEIQIHLLGRFFVLVQGKEVEESSWTRKKAKTLIQLLALAPQRRVSREKAAETLWPEMELEAAIANLHKAVHAARRTLEPSLRQGAASRFLFYQEGQLFLAAEPELCIDWETFERQALASLKVKNLQDCEAALALYAGDLLEEYVYEDFCSVAREQSRNLCERLLEEISRQQEALGSPGLNESLERLLRFNPVNEDARRRLMRQHLQAGQRHLALEQYRLCCEAVKTELDAEPEKETKALFERILAGDAAVRPRPMDTALPEADVVRSPEPASAGLGRRNMAWALAGVAGLAAAGMLWRRENGRAPSGGARTRSVAILPIRASRNEQEENILAEGITEGLIHSASRLPKLRVMARATVFSYQNRSDALAIGRELKVTQVVNGRIVKEGGLYTVSLELVDVSDGARLWGQQFYSKAEEIQNLQEKLNSELARVLGPVAEAQETRVGDKRPLPNAGAYQLYLNGRYFANQRTAESLLKAKSYFEQAITRDSDYALAHAGLADSLGLLGVSVAEPKELMPRAKSAAERAIALDESLAEAHTSLAMVHALYEWDWAKAEKEFRRAILLNEGYSTAHHWYGVNLAGQGRHREASLELAKAVDLDPLSAIIQLNCGYPHYYQTNYAEALTYYNKALELKPDFQTALEDRSLIEHLQGQQSKSVETLLRLLQLSGEEQLEKGFARVCRASGYPAGLRYLVSFYEAQSQSRFVPPMKIASLAMRAGDHPKTYFWLEKAYQQRAALLTYVAVDPIYTELRKQSGFRDLLQRVGLSAA
jgi:DNA-binding SARP family transcriptional activator/TolB-like protein